MGDWVNLTAADGHEFAAWVALPEGAPRMGVVVVQEIFGVNSHIRAVADDFASEGFAAVAPALFDRVERGVELDYSSESIARGAALAKQVGGAMALADIEAALVNAHAICRMRPGIVGYCFGGTMAWLAATRLDTPQCAVSYYGGQVPQLAHETPRCPVMLHFGERDPHIPLESVHALAAAHPDAEVFTYPAGHGFNCGQRTDYDDESAALARSRTLEFLRRYENGRLD